MKHNYYRICPYCGATLDPEERCSCREAREAFWRLTGGKEKKDTPEENTRRDAA